MCGTWKQNQNGKSWNEGQKTKVWIQAEQMRNHLFPPVIIITFKTFQKQS